ncbi:methyltransferase [Flavisolibacter ginsenosidimutans]|uniref:Methyltransferase n=1 Tax=Flavisolibacter ginsenosidimutans TaxID=661481 RepID=A0A5B8UE08_9BACT|nr:methyltransferase [Flavisolibacter ginsenosidimutans]QEC54536.1 methyltransferase [Flavisolibacter ginsenosidimutans]
MLAESTAKQTNVPVTLDPSRIMQFGMGFWASKVLLTAVKLNLFTHLASGALSAKGIKEKLGLGASDRHVYDWLDALVSLGLLERKGLLDEALYSNAEDTDFFLDKNKRSYTGGILEMANNRLYKFWNDLEDGLRTGQPQNEGKGKPQGNMEFFTELYQNEERLQEFMDAMSGIQAGNFMLLVNKFDFNTYDTMLDVGGADGWLSVQVCLRHPSIQCTTYDLPPVKPLAERKIAQFSLSNRIRVAGGDFLKDELPKAGIVTMGNILHGMNEETKAQLVKKVYDLLPEGGALMAIENIIDDERRQNTFGLLMSLNMLIENGDAFDYTMADFERWTKAAGFKRTERIPLAGPTSAAVAHK